MDLATLAHQQQLWAQGIIITTLCAQYTAFLMASSHEKAQWSDWEITGLVDYLYEHKSEMGDAGMFKMSTFNAVAQQDLPRLLRSLSFCPPNSRNDLYRSSSSYTSSNVNTYLTQLKTVCQRKGRS
ncbi:hypothetical protein BYT27DRAFT_7254319 [Phlegmacium glaucopus]|nr:hypothetical protein BYT27DRAFT_7254319 [Phlegmacium glaucopus]